MKINMRYCWLIFACLIGSSTAIGQDEFTWKVNIGKKTVLTTSQEDTTANTIQIKKSDLGNNGLFKIELTQKNKDAAKGWVRTVVLVDSAENMMVQRDSTNNLQLYNRDLLKLMWARKKLKAFTWASPADPAMAAAIRIKRMHLCTLILID